MLKLLNKLGVLDENIVQEYYIAYLEQIGHRMREKWIGQ